MWTGIQKARDAVAHGFEPKLRDGASSLWYSNWLGTSPLASRVPFVHILDTMLTVVDVWRQGRWSFEGLNTQISQEIKEEVMGILVTTRHIGEDKLCGKRLMIGTI